MLKIKEEFKKLIPPLTAEEFKQLETNCIEEGIRDAIVTWQGFIIDGHNRYKIATDWQLSFKTIEKNFDSEEAVKEWMIINQFGRRNLSNYDRAKLGLELKEILEHKAKLKEALRKSIQQTKAIDLENIKPEQKAIVEILSGYKKRAYATPDKIYFVQNEDRVKIGVSNNIESRLNDIKKHIPDCHLIGYCEGGIDLEKQIHNSLIDCKLHNEWFKLNDLSISLIKSFIENADFSDFRKVNSYKEAAEKFKIGHDTIAKVKVIEQKAAPEIKEKLSTGELSINQAYQDIKKEEKIKERTEYIEQQKKEIAENKLPPLTGLYDIISVDPPWNYGREYDPENSRIANPYPEMSIDEIKAIKLPFSDNSIIFLWTTHKFLPDSFDILKHWGFEYKATLVWNKEKIGMGSWFRMQCEFCLFAIKGKPFWNNTTERDIIIESRREHSRKPDSFFDMIDKICIGRKLEYFSREKRNGWDIFGNDINKF